LTLHGSRGIHKPDRARLKRDFGDLAPWASLDKRARDAVLARFAEVADVAGVDVVDAGRILVLLGRPNERSSGSLRNVSPLLEAAVRHIAHRAKLVEQSAQLDLGLAWTAHEVKGPLLGARASLDSVLADHVPDDATGDLLRRSSEELNGLADLVDSVLHWAGGTSELRLEPTDLRALVGDAVKLCSLEQPNRKISVSTNGSAHVEADARHLRGAVANLVRNALAYSPAKGEVRVSVSTPDGVARVEVRDDGPGIDPTERESVFSPFVRGRESRGGRAGSGMGLFITRRVAEAHGGRVFVGEEGAGATVVLELPRRKQP
jgi:signal transduction histidine kinase